jgi:ArsR family transcriptional regulator
LGSSDNLSDEILGRNRRQNPYQRGTGTRQSRPLLPVGVDIGSSVGYRCLTMTKPKRTPQNCCPPANQEADLRPVEGDEADEEMATLTKAIGHPVRVKILRLLVRKDTCICGDIVDRLPLAQSTVSQHLKVLKDAGLIRGEVEGPRGRYCIEPRTLRRLKALVGGI